MAKGTEIQVNKEFSFESYDYGWIVNHHKKGISKISKKKITVTNTCYFPRLEQCCNHVIDNTTKKCKTVKEIMGAVAVAKNDLTKMLKKLDAKGIK